ALTTVASMSGAILHARGSTVAFATLLVGAVSLQMLPLPSALLHPLAHHTLYATRVEAAHAWESVTISPAQTSRAAACLRVLVIFGIGLISWLSYRPRATMEIARNVAIIGTLVAIEGIVQRRTFNGKIYWFWESQWHAPFNYFGPFVNRNHFAGW